MKFAQPFDLLSNAALAILCLPWMTAAQLSGLRTIQSFVDGQPFVEAVQSGIFAELVIEPSPTSVNGHWTLQEVANGQYTVLNSATGYASFTFDARDPDFTDVVTSPDSPTAWTITLQNTTEFGSNLYTISAPVTPGVPDSQVIWWTVHEATNILFADLTHDPADSFVNRLWHIV